jgi:chemotaxis protein MotA
MDASVIFGILLGLGAIFAGNLLEGGHIASLVQSTAALIVFGGTFGAIIVSHGLKDFRLALRMLTTAMRSSHDRRIQEVGAEIVAAAQLARRESLLALEGRLNSMSSPYMRNVFRYMIDGIESETLRRIFESEIIITESRALRIVKVWSDAGGFAPTVGILGAVLGLIHVMGNLSDTTALGQGIAVAFVATIYGVGSANLIFLPIANRLQREVADDCELKQMIIEGATGIASGLNPYIIEEKMRTFTSVARRAT